MVLSIAVQFSKGTKFTMQYNTMNKLNVLWKLHFPEEEFVVVNDDFK